MDILQKFFGSRFSLSFFLEKKKNWYQNFIQILMFFFSVLKAQSKDKEKEEFECPTNVGNGNFADPVTCRRFYQVCIIF